MLRIKMAAEILWEEDPCYFVFNDHIPGKVKMHTRRLDLKDWIRIDKTYPGQMRLRKKLIETKLDKVFVSNTDEEIRNSKWELFEMLVEYLPKRFPEIFVLHEKGIYNKFFDEYISTSKENSEDPLIRLGRLVQEDWVLMQWKETEQRYVLSAAILCFPMGWSLQEKFNKSMMLIHKPVDLFMTHLLKKVTDVFYKMTPNTPLWRANWGIYPNLNGSLDLYTPPNENKEKKCFDGDETGRTIQLRHEYQTLRKLTKTKCIVFSIRTYQRYLEEFESFPVQYSENLIQVIQEMDESTAIYKEAPLWKDATVKYLKYITKKRSMKKPGPNTCNLISSFRRNWFLSTSVLSGFVLVGMIVFKVNVLK